MKNPFLAIAQKNKANSGNDYIPGGNWFPGNEPRDKSEEPLPFWAAMPAEWEKGVAQPQRTYGKIEGELPPESAGITERSRLYAEAEAAKQTAERPEWVTYVGTVIPEAAKKTGQQLLDAGVRDLQLLATPFSVTIEITRQGLQGADWRTQLQAGIRETQKPLRGVIPSVTKKLELTDFIEELPSSKRIPEHLKELGLPDWVATYGGETIEMLPYFLTASSLAGIMSKGGTLGVEATNFYKGALQRAIQVGDYKTYERLSNILKEARGVRQGVEKFLEKTERAAREGLKDIGKGITPVTELGPGAGQITNIPSIIKMKPAKETIPLTKLNKLENEAIAKAEAVAGRPLTLEEKMAAAKSVTEKPPIPGEVKPPAGMAEIRTEMPSTSVKPAETHIMPSGEVMAGKTHAEAMGKFRESYPKPPEYPKATAIQNQLPKIRPEMRMPPTIGKPPKPPKSLPPAPEIPPEAFRDTPEQFYNRLQKATNSKLTSMREYVQDQFIRVRRLMNEVDERVLRATDPYSKMALMPGRVSVRMEVLDKTVKAIDNDVIGTAKKLKVIDEDIIRDVNNRLIAIHAPERNAILGEKAAGMTNDEARNVLSAITTKGSQYEAEIKRISGQIKALNNQVLDVLEAGQIIDPKFKAFLRERYPNHIPLNRIMESDLLENFPEILTGGKGFKVSGTGLKRAIGSEREVSDIMSNVVSNLKAAIIRSEKNLVDLSTLHWARDIERQYKAGLFEEIKPKSWVTKEGYRMYKDTPSPIDPSILPLRENGKQIYLKINNPKLAIAFRGVGKYDLDPLTKGIGVVTRFYSGLATRFNPEFAIPNIFRDVQEAIIYMGARNEIGLKNAARTATRQPGSMKDIWDWVMGKDTAGTRLYQQLRLDGGTTGGLALSTREQVTADIEAIRKLNRSNPRQAAKFFMEKVDQWNTLFEDATRLSVYKESLANGLTRERAAFLAKRASIDFNQMGRGGPLINSIYMFSNASIQGTAKMIGAMKNPKVAATVVAGLGTATFVVNQWNDSIDSKWRDTVPKWDRMNSLIIMLPNGDYVKLPVSWSVKPIKVSFDALYETATGKSDWRQNTDKLITSVLDAYNPTGGTDVISALTPTILDIPIELARNKKWSGAKIKPDIMPWTKSMPEHLRYYPSLQKTAAGRGAIEITKIASKAIGIEISPADVEYAYQQLVGGAGRFIGKVAETIIAFGKGELPPSRSIPVINRFYGQPEQKRKSINPFLKFTTRPNPFIGLKSKRENPFLKFKKAQ